MGVVCIVVYVRNMGISSRGNDCIELDTRKDKSLLKAILYYGIIFIACGIFLFVSWYVLPWLKLR